MRLFLENRRLMCPVLWGRTSSEFFAVPETESREAFREMAGQVFGEDAEAYLGLFDLDHDSLEETIRKASFPTIDLAIRAMSAQNEKSGACQPLYYYNFDAEIPGWDNAGTFHSVDLWFFFETLAKCWRPFTGKHYDLARQMCNYWANFIRCGDPNGTDSTGEPMPRWDPMTTENNACMVFDEKPHQVCEAPDPLMTLAIRTWLKSKGC